LLDVDEYLLKLSSEIKTEKKNGIRIIYNKKKKIYAIDQFQLQKESISSKESADVGRMRNLYIPQITKCENKPTDNAQPCLTSQIELSQKESSEVQQIPLMYYNPYLSQYPMNMMPYPISTNAQYMPLLGVDGKQLMCYPQFVYPDYRMFFPYQQGPYLNGQYGCSPANTQASERESSAKIIKD
jgi:hypothetical protein